MLEPDDKKQTQIKKILAGIIGILFLFYVISCGDSESTPSPSTDATPPENLRQVNTCAKTTSVDLTWDAVSGATSYKLYRDKQEIAGNITTNFYTDTGLSAGTSYTYTVRVCKGSSCSDDSNSLTTTTISDKSLKAIIDLGSIPTDLGSYDQKYQDIFSRYVTNTPIVARYLSPGGTGDGSSPTNKAGNLKTVIERIPDASADKVYVVLLTGGNYRAGSQMAMKNHVAIIGGLEECLDLSPDQVTELDGNNTHRVFHNNQNNLTNTALLYGVTITNGRDNVGGGMYNISSSPSLVGVTFSGNSADNRGGGMYNDNSSPSLVGVTFSGNRAGSTGGGMYNYTSSPSLVGVTFSGNFAKYDGGGMYNYDNSSPSLVGVTFSENTANDTGGGMYNDNSSPSLVGVTFSGNTANNDGGGMYNWESSPSLVGVTFSENTADYGGGMYNWESSPSLVGVTFSGNTANNDGGGMYNYTSSPSLVGVTFSGNKAAQGGGMYNDNDGKDGALIINGIFWGNTASSVGPQFYFHNDSTNQENLRIYNSIVEGGTGTLTNGTTYTNVNQGGFVFDGGSAPVMISFANITNTDPQLQPLADNGGSVLTHAIAKGSSAVDWGLYVKKSGNTFYYSADKSTWYTEPDLSGTTITPPADAEDLTATDATGYTRTGKPDLGAYEAR